MKEIIIFIAALLFIVFVSSSDWDVKRLECEVGKVSCEAEFYFD